MGELDVDNQNNCLRRDPTNGDVTSNMELNLTLNINDRRVWKTIYSVMFHLLENIIPVPEGSVVEY